MYPSNQGRSQLKLDQETAEEIRRRRIRQRQQRHALMRTGMFSAEQLTAELGNRETLGEEYGISGRHVDYIAAGYRWYK